MNKRKKWEFFETKICPICNKEFLPAPYHVFKVYHRTKLVCSYHCALESERRALENKKTKEKKE